MSAQQPRYSAEEIARRGDSLYEQHVRVQVETENRGKIVAIDIDTGAFAVADTALAASKCLLAQRPEAEIWLVRIGSPSLHRIGSR